MKFRFVLVALVATLSLNASAQSAFELVDSLFANGTAFDLCSKVGNYSGRCWSDKSETPIDVLLIIEQKISVHAGVPVVTKFGIYKGSEDSLSTYQNMFKRSWDSLVMLPDNTHGHTMTYAEYAQYLKLSLDTKYMLGKSFDLKSNEVLSCYFAKQIQ